MSESISEDTYWQSRATTAEEKVKEWSVRACEAEQRMAKARAILEKLVGTRQGKEIMQAIAVLQGQEALEGK